MFSDLKIEIPKEIMPEKKRSLDLEELIYFSSRREWMLSEHLEMTSFWLTDDICASVGIDFFESAILGNIKPILLELKAARKVVEAAKLYISSRKVLMENQKEVDWDAFENLESALKELEGGEK